MHGELNGWELEALRDLAFGQNRADVRMALESWFYQRRDGLRRAAGRGQIYRQVMLVVEAFAEAGDPDAEEILTMQRATLERLRAARWYASEPRRQMTEEEIQEAIAKLSAAFTQVAESFVEAVKPFVEAIQTVLGPIMDALVSWSDSLTPAERAASGLHWRATEARRRQRARQVANMLARPRRIRAAA